MFVICVHRRVVEGSGVGSSGCVVHMLICVESESCCEWLQCIIATEHGRCMWSVLYVEAVERMSCAEFVCRVGVLLLNTEDMAVLYVNAMSTAECLVDI